MLSVAALVLRQTPLVVANIARVGAFERFKEVCQSIARTRAMLVMCVHKSGDSALEKI